jgi:hypothetical protein
MCSYNPYSKWGHVLAVGQYTEAWDYDCFNKLTLALFYKLNCN